jgi:hypothetical protein
MYALCKQAYCMRMKQFATLASMKQVGKHDFNDKHGSYWQQRLLAAPKEDMCCNRFPHFSDCLACSTSSMQTMCFRHT